MDPKDPKDAPLQLLGVSMWGPPPVGEVHLPFEHGVSVLYGLNGAGKTAILNNLRIALEGIRPPDGRILLHARVSDSVELDRTVDQLTDGSARTVVAESIRQVFDSYVKEEFAEQHSSMDYRIALQRRGFELPLINASFNQLHENAFRLAMDEDNEQLISEANQRLFCLMPIGDSEAAWFVSIGARLSFELTPNLALACLPRGKRKERSEGLNINPVDSGMDLDAELLLLPDWVPAQILPLAASDFGGVLPWLIDEGSRDPVQALLAGARQLSPILKGDGDEVDISDEADEFFTGISARSSQLLARVMRDPPVMRFDLDEPQNWLDLDPVTALAMDRYSGALVSLSELSQAERRWATVCALLAIGEEAAPLGIGVLVLDEVEAALHTSAVRHMVEGLKAISTELGFPIVVATHSRDLLNDPDVILYHVERDDSGSSMLTLLDGEQRSARSSDRLGLTFADAIQLHRVILVVEGDHDAAVMRALIGRKLDDARTWIIPMRGTHNLMSLVEGQFLFDATDAMFVIVVDHIPVKNLPELWQRAQHYAKTDSEKALRVLRPLADAGRRGHGTNEARVLYELCEKALQRKRADRIILFGLLQKDILRYLDVQLLIPDAQSWAEVEKEWRRSPDYEPGRFKEWVAEYKGSPLTTESVTEAALSSIERMPAELEELALTCLEASRWYGRSGGSST